jgi:hypothetical protein
MPASHFALLAGLLNRCCRLMLANIKLTDDGLFAESSRILDRCIMESAFRLRWLCRKNDPNFFQCCIADGLKAEVELRQNIRRQINARGGTVLPIEDRMLRSTERMLNASGMTEGDVCAAPHMPRFDKICGELDLPHQFYLAVQKIGSHPVHGSWSDLMTFYLEWDQNNGFKIADHNARPHDNQYIFGSLFVIDATIDFLKFIDNTQAPIEKYAPELLEARDLIININRILAEPDFKTRESGAQRC